MFAEKKRTQFAPPGPRPLPLIGNLLDMVGADPHIRLTEMAETFGTVFQVRFGREPVVVINDIDLAKEALVKNGDDFAGRAHLPTTDLLSNSGMGIAFADYGRGWRIHKKLTHNSLKMFGQGMFQLEDKITTEADWLCGYLKTSSGAPLDPYLPLNTVVGNVISSICFGKRFEPEDDEFRTIIGYNEGLVDTVGKDALIDVFPWLAKLPNSTVTKMKQCLKTRDNVLNNNIEEHRVNIFFKLIIIFFTIEGSFKDGQPRDLVDALLKAQAEAAAEGGRKAQRYLSDEHILTTVNDVFGGGMETSTTTLRWILAFLLHHPEKQVGDFDVPQGTRVMFNLWAIHHDERHWTDPATFNPDRFLDAKTGQLLRGGSFLPFLAGCRGCLGESMAKAELFLFTARILRDFRLELPDGVSPPSLQGRYGVVMAPDRYDICFRPRNA
uniref:Steroid 17-alpha-hydroxylase/17,20 lyase n=1 Tax=Branchiostoma floridae TaxID=7739 RepID=C3XVC7_BRAFL|eukprot:XP_002612044.1 hypothetical protein BRAFLDRAFT_60656 [Branchiostoma floridae]